MYRGGPFELTPPRGRKRSVSSTQRQRQQVAGAGGGNPRWEGREAPGMQDGPWRGPTEGRSGMDPSHLPPPLRDGGGDAGGGRGGGSAPLPGARWRQNWAPSRTPAGGGQQNVVVIGTGAFGVWTAYHLQKMGATVSLVDLYGPGELPLHLRRRDPGDPHRLRGPDPLDRLGQQEPWPGGRSSTQEYAPKMGHPVYFETGDLILRPEFDTFLQQTRPPGEALGIQHERPGCWIEVGPAVAPVRAGGDRCRGCTSPMPGWPGPGRRWRGVAQIVQGQGAPPPPWGGRRWETSPGDGSRTFVLGEQGERVGGDIFVFALGPWFPKQFPEFMPPPDAGSPWGWSFYYGKPRPGGPPLLPHPNIPSWNFPGVTGWANLPLDQRGFRVRSSGKPGDDPDTSVRWVAEELHGAVQGDPDGALPPTWQMLRSWRPPACHYESTVTRDWINRSTPRAGECLDRPDGRNAGGHSSSAP